MQEKCEINHWGIWKDRRIRQSSLFWTRKRFRELGVLQAGVTLNMNKKDAILFWFWGKKGELDTNRISFPF